MITGIAWFLVVFALFCAAGLILAKWEDSDQPPTLHGRPIPLKRALVAEAIARASE